ncbi:hypothetical protein Q0590_03435 [Rhodocytophaga aerolata]|uniref:Uncharacterized protein n=1 Tax=Rhodocytophaga aerolata TaxID=455078 RepID=A0ABT8R3R5_9BACT|nr:hypothetical protein [Rhodocytophaga aerolata]MDO1445285.1 hypothetical protein [Rhodocytophaga aerolata]
MLKIIRNSEFSLSGLKGFGKELRLEKNSFNPFLLPFPSLSSTKRLTHPFEPWNFIFVFYLTFTSTTYAVVGAATAWLILACG